MSKQTTAEKITWIEGQIRAKQLWLRDHASKFPESLSEAKQHDLDMLKKLYSDYQAVYVRYQEKEAV